MGGGVNSQCQERVSDTHITLWWQQEVRATFIAEMDKDREEEEEE